MADPGHREILRTGLALALLLAWAQPNAADARRLNDIHSRLNATEVAEYHEPASTAEIVALVERARDRGLAISISGGQHAMGGQQFGAGTLHINLSAYGEVLALDAQRGLVTVQSGIQWPALIEWLIANQPPGRGS